MYVYMYATCIYIYRDICFTYTYTYPSNFCYTFENKSMSIHASNIDRFSKV